MINYGYSNDHKKALCSSLVAVSKQIDEYQEKLEQTQHSAQLVRTELKELSKQSQTISTSSKCSLCFAPLLNNSFLGREIAGSNPDTTKFCLVFLCGHQFHSKCALEEVYSFCKDEEVLSKVRDAQTSLAALNNFESNAKNPLLLLQAKAKEAVLNSGTVNEIMHIIKKNIFYIILK